MQGMTLASVSAKVAELEARIAVAARENKRLRERVAELERRRRQVIEALRSIEAGFSVGGIESLQDAQECARQALAAEDDG